MPVKFKSLVFLLFISANVLSQDEWDDWEDDSWEEETSAWQVSGFVEAAYGQRLQNDSLFEDKQTLNELRAHVESSLELDKVKWNFKFDIWNDDVVRDVELDLRELNITFSAFDHFDFKLGRQVTTWGTGDLLFLNDLFPKDWQSFFSGREDTYLKAPSDSVRVSGFFDLINLDLLWTPEHSPDRFINGERFSFYNPFVDSNLGGQAVINPQLPNRSLGNGELSLRLHKNIKGREVALYAYRGFDKQPLALEQDFTAYFSRKNVYGVSLRGNLGKGLYHLEYAYHQSKSDSQGSDPLIPNSQSRLLIGYEREMLPKLNWSTQAYVEKTHDYQNLLSHSFNPELEPHENRTVITQRWTYRMMQDKLNWSLFAFYSPSDDDNYLRPVVSFRKNDQWNYILGGNVFSGQQEHSFFGQFENSSNAYIRIRYNF